MSIPQTDISFAMATLNLAREVSARAQRVAAAYCGPEADAYRLDTRDSSSASVGALPMLRAYAEETRSILEQAHQALSALERQIGE